MYKNSTFTKALLFWKFRRKFLLDFWPVCYHLSSPPSPSSPLSVLHPHPPLPPPPYQALPLVHTGSCHGDGVSPGVGSGGCCHGDPRARCAPGGGGRRGLQRAAARVRGAIRAPQRRGETPARGAIQPGQLLHAASDWGDRHRAPAGHRQSADRAGWVTDVHPLYYPCVSRDSVCSKHGTATGETCFDAMMG